MAAANGTDELEAAERDRDQPAHEQPAGVQARRERPCRKRRRGGAAAASIGRVTSR
jgi:hypothetical protein